MTDPDLHAQIAAATVYETLHVPAIFAEWAETVLDAARDSLENSPAYSLEVDLLHRLVGQQAADALRAPFVLGERAELAALFERSGVASVEIATRTGTARFPSVRTMVEADLRGWLPVMGVDLSEDQIERVLREAESVLAGFVESSGQVVFDSPAHIVTWRKP